MVDAAKALVAVVSYSIGQVPTGWTKGEPLSWIGNGPRYALMRKVYAIGEEPIMSDQIAAIEFNCLEDAKAWLKWWKS